MRYGGRSAVVLFHPGMDWLATDVRTTRLAGTRPEKAENGGAAR